jgi:hypothetical protein
MVRASEHYFRPLNNVLTPLSGSRSRPGFFFFFFFFFFGGGFGGKAGEVKGGPRVAIKEIRNLQDKGIVKRLLREIRLLKHFKSHPYVRFENLPCYLFCPVCASCCYYPIP